MHHTPTYFHVPENTQLVLGETGRQVQFQLQFFPKAAATHNGAALLAQQVLP